MQNSGFKRLVQTLMTTGLATLFALGINFLLTPFVTSKLGVEAYGFITLANMFVSYAMIIMTAINSFATRFIALEYHSGNLKGASGYFSTLFFSNLVISVAIFLALIPFILCIDHVLDVPYALVSDVQYLFVLVFFNFLITNASTSFSSAAYIKNRLDIYGIFQTLSYVIEAAILIGSYCSFHAQVQYFGYGLLAAGLVILVGNVYIYRKYAPELHISPRLFSLGSVKTLVICGIWNSINALGNVLNNGISLLVANLLLNAVAMGQLAISKTFMTMFSRLYQLVSQAFQPRFLESYSKKDLSGLTRDLILSMKLSGFVAVLFFAGFFSLGYVFYTLWMPEQDARLLYILTVINLAGSLSEGFVTPLYYIYSLTLKNKIPCLITLFGGFINVFCMYILMMYTDMGVYSAVLMTCLVTVAINCITNPIYMAKCLKLKLSTFYPTLARLYFATVLTCLVFYLVASMLCPSTWFDFFAVALVLALVAIVLFPICVLNRSELQLIKIKIKRMAKVSGLVK